MKKRPATGRVKKMGKSLGQRPSGVAASTTDVSEGFRRARSSIADITTDLKQLQRRATSAVKGPRGPSKSE